MNTTVILWIDDLFRRTQLQQKLAARQISTQVPLNPDDVVTQLQTNPRAMVLMDLEHPALTEENLIALKPFASRIVAFYPHVKKESAERIQKMGFSHVYPRSRVFGNLFAVLNKVATDINDS